jgi:hypothetical protein
MSKALILSFILMLHQLILSYFLGWYFLFSGYLGMGYGELAIIAAVIIIYIFSIALLLMRKRILAAQFHGVVYFGLVLFYVFSIMSFIRL